MCGNEGQGAAEACAGTGICTHDRPGRITWEKVRANATVDAVIGGVFGQLNDPQALVLGRPDATGALRAAGRTGPLPQAARR
jgi:hypothetical protein